MIYLVASGNLPRVPPAERRCDTLTVACPIDHLRPAASRDEARLASNAPDGEC